MKHHIYPEFPITVTFLDDGDEWVLDNEIELAENLEWFNSDDPEEKTIIKDKNGKAVKLVVEKLEIKHFSLSLKNLIK